MKRHAVTLCTILTICLSAWSGAAGAQAFPTLSVGGLGKIAVGAGRVAATPFVVGATLNNAPLAGAHVRFTTPGLCGTFSGASLADVVTDANGQASAPSFTAGPFPDTCTVTAALTSPDPSRTLPVSYTVYIYDAHSLVLFADPATVALIPGQSWQGTATLRDSGARPIINAAVQVTSPSAACGAFGTTLSTIAQTDGGGTAVIAGFKAGPAVLDCVLTVQWADGGVATTVPVEIFDPALSTVATAPGATSGWVNEGSWIMMQPRSPPGTWLANTALTFGVTADSTTGASATLDRVGQTTDTHGIVNVLATANDKAGSYSIDVGLLGMTKSILVTTAPRVGLKPAAPGGKYGDMWWGGPSQNGWGISVIQHRDTLFAVMFMYGPGGNPAWVVFPGGNWDASHVYYSGTMYITVGSPYFNYDAQRLLQSGLGFMTLAFLTDDSGWVQLDTASFGKSVWNITRQKFGPPASAMGDHTDMWWGGPTQNGWGISVIQQNQSLFVVWFTYDENRQVTWFVAPAGAWTAPETWEADLYRATSGSNDMIHNSVYDPTPLKVNKVGTIRMRFAGGNAIFEYTANGFSNTLQLVRQSF
jgi:hypothetical protein